MQNKPDINKLIEDTLNSVNDIRRASPAPYLLTRINNFERSVKPSSWELFIGFLTRPAIALTLLLIIVTINFLIISSGNNSSNEYYYEDMTSYQATGSTAVYEIDNLIP